MLLAEAPAPLHFGFNEKHSIAEPPSPTLVQNYLKAQESVVSFTNPAQRPQQPPQTPHSWPLIAAPPSPPTQAEAPVGKAKKRKGANSDDGSAWCSNSKGGHDVSPHEYLIRMLSKRGYSAATVPALRSSYARQPTEQQITDYRLDVVNAVRSCDLSALQALRAAGVDMCACNRFGESIIHMAARMNALEMLQFMVAGSEAGLHISDDYGRTPLHDACWTSEPEFQMIAFILDRELGMLFVTDRRGYTPLAYVKRELWPVWCAFFEEVKDTYWPVQQKR